MCSGEQRGEEEGQGPVAAWWEEWEDQGGPSRKRKHPTSRPTAEDAQEDQGLTGLTVEVRPALCLVAAADDHAALAAFCMPGQLIQKQAASCMHLPASAASHPCFQAL